MAITDAGENKAWELLAALEPRLVRDRAAAGLDEASGAYLIPSFGRRFSVHTGDRRILSLEPRGAPLLTDHGDLFRLSILWYLVGAAPSRPTGSLVRPSALPGGGIFTKGTHVLPLGAIAETYATTPDAFLTAGAALGGRVVPYGDAAVELPALPKVPATVILWTADEEFPARADLLFDRTCAAHLATDILWSVAMLSVRLLQA